MNSVFFISDGTDITASVVHRCFMISNNLKEFGYKSKVYTSGDFYGVQNLIIHFNNYKKILKEKPDVVVIHKTSSIFDYYMIKQLKNKNIKVLYDFDDAIFLTRFPGIISFSHIKRIIKEAEHTFAGSQYLYDYSYKINNNVSLLPTAVDTDLFYPIEKKDQNKIIIGWMGNGDDYQSRYLKQLIAPLRILSKKYDIKFRIISAFSNKVKQAFANEHYDVDFGLDKWAPIESMPEIISDFDIGIMPLTNTDYEKGKCAMKALEYMSMQIPVVASAVGENNRVIIDGYNGFLAKNTGDWVKNLEKLILDNDLRKLMGKNGRKFVEDKYSVKVITKKFINKIEELTIS